MTDKESWMTFTWFNNFCGPFYFTSLTFRYRIRITHPYPNQAYELHFSPGYDFAELLNCSLPTSE